MTDHAGDIPIEHVQRPTPPWRVTSLLTECGLPIANHPIITREALVAKVKKQGQQRAKITTCQTCWSTAERWWGTWEEDPVKAIGREVEWHGRWGRARELRSSFKEELVAIALLIQRHPEEFAELLQDQAEIVKLSSARATKPPRPRRMW
jgi:hypothetical protein